jgi:uncharacterized membrane protein YdjX (TVP38/TMEM64 family)
MSDHETADAGEVMLGISHAPPVLRGVLTGRHVLGRRRLFLLAAMVFVAWHFYLSGTFNPARIKHLSARHPVEAIMAFILADAVSVIACLPSLPLNLAAGYLWGGLAGGIYAAIGATLGGFVAFLAGRLVIGQKLAGWRGGGWAHRVTSAFNQIGWKFLALARINPIIPTGPFNYLLSLTALSNRGFLLGSLFLLPPSIAVAYIDIGDSLQTFSAHQPHVQALLRSLLIVSIAVTLLVCARFLTKFLEHEFAAEDRS